MGLLDLKTDLKSLKFGNPPASDRPGGGNSGQPYITDPISSDIIPQSEDFLLRGGLNAPLDAANDVIRLTKFFGDLKSPRGVLFTSKQNILSRIGAATQASGNQSTPNKWKSSALNEGLYTPLSTIAQAGVGFTGAHLYKQGLNPLKGVNTYLDSKTLIIGESDGTNNRLVDLYNTKTLNEGNGFSIDDPTNIYSYSGGPGSKLGVGKTNIKFATDNKGAPLFSGAATKDYQTGLNYDRFSLSNPPTGVSNKWFDYTKLLDSVSLPELTTGGGITYEPYNLPSVYNPGTLKNSTRVNDNNTLTWDQSRIEGETSLNDSTNKSYSTQIQDFRAPLLEDKKSSTIMSFAPSYEPKDKKTIDGPSTSRINQESPGQTGNVINYEKGKIIGEINGKGGRVSVVDQINYLPIYESETNRSSEKPGINDLVKFRIGAVLRSAGNTPPKKVYMHFRAFIDKFSDSYDAKWSGTSYMGRGEEFYKYGGFSRKISLSYTIAAQSKPELMAQYKKLNFLASTLAPDYGSSGYMGGVLTTLTLGGWCHELPGFISSLSLDIPSESPWEIAIDKDPVEGKGDPTVKEMPHICKVNMSFTPIHNFRPELQTNIYSGSGGEVSKYGNQQYIALDAGAGSNYKQAISLKKAQTP